MADGTRTHYSRNHNPGLYQLSYGHHNYDMRDGAPGRARTCDPRLRRPMLYPAELRAHLTLFLPGIGGRGRGIRTPDILLPKQARYRTALYPEFCRSTAESAFLIAGRILRRRQKGVNRIIEHARANVESFGIVMIRSRD